MITSGSPSILPGLTLKAFALSPNGGVTKGSNIATVTRTAVGTYTVTFTAALLTSTYFVDVKMMQVSAAAGVISYTVTVPTTAGFTLNTYQGVTAADQLELFIACYE